MGLNWFTTAENQREKPIRKFSIDPASSIRTSIADPVFADPVSETPIISRCPSTASRTVWKRKGANFQRVFLVSLTEKERKHAFVRVRFRLFLSTVWAGRECGLDWFRVRFRYPRRWERVREPHAKQYSDSALYYRLGTRSPVLPILCSFGFSCFFFSEPFAMGPVQFRFSWPRGAAENRFTKPGFWEHFVSFFLGKTAKHRVH